MTLFFIEPVILYDKFIDAMRLNENELIYIFMNISRNVKNREKMRKKTIDIAKVKMGYKICLVSLKQILMAASVARAITSMS